MQSRTKILLLALLMLPMGLVQTQRVNIVQMAMNWNFTTLVRAIAVADLGSILNSSGPITIFAPMDTAFDKLPTGVPTDLLKTENKGTINRILQYHVFLGNVTSISINTTNQTVNLIMLIGVRTTLTRNTSTFRINNANFVRPDIVAANGMIHAIDAVLMPPLDIIDTAVINGNLTTLINASRTADLAYGLKVTGPFTLFAPIDAAFNKLPSGVLMELLKPENKGLLDKILRYHILDRNMSYAAINASNVTLNQTTWGGAILTLRKNASEFAVNDAKVLKADIIAQNGILHTIDSVLLPLLDIFETTIINGNFTTLVTALRTASLLATLQGLSPLTFFAPTNAAFEKLSSSVIKDLIRTENKDTLMKILRYHVTLGYFTAIVVNTTNQSTNLTMLNGGRVTLARNGSILRVNNANIVKMDTFAKNGVIHAIDTVLLPSLDIVETAILNVNLTTLVAAVRAADLLNTLKGLGPFTLFAPNDAAFNKLPVGALDKLLQVQNKPNLSNILRYHVLSQRLSTTDLNNMTLPRNLLTLAGVPIKVAKTGNTLQINGANVITPDVSTTNGLIHIIDTVLLLPQSASHGSLIYPHRELLTIVAFFIFFHIYR